MYTLPSARTVDWTYAGVPGGIPNRTDIYTTLSPGATAPQIEAAISACSAAGGGVVYLAEGSYTINGLQWPSGTSNVTLRGAGAGKTIISITPVSGRMYCTMQSSYFGYKTRYATTGGCAKGATTITMASTPPADAVVGRLMAIEEDADGYLTFNASSDSSRQSAHSHTCRITNVTGNVITFTPPNLYQYPTTTGSGLTQYIQFSNGAPISLCGWENLTLRPTTGYTILYAVWAMGCDRCWFKKCEITGFVGQYGQLRFDYNHQCEIRQCYIHDNYNWPNTGNAIAIYIWVQSDHFLVEDNIFYHNGMALLVSNSSGHVIGYNYDYATGRPDVTAGCIPSSYCLDHHAHPLMILVEGNYGSWLTNDGVHGSSTHHTIFRNNFNGLHPTLSGHRWMIVLAQGCYYHNLLGNVLGDSSWSCDYYELMMDGTSYSHTTTECIYKLQWPNDGNFHTTPDIYYVYPSTHPSYPGNWSQTFPDTNVRSTAIIHGNYDYYNSSVYEWADADHALPDSLYHDSKPSWFGELAWPPIGPDVSGYTTDTPSRWRWNRYLSTSDLDDLFTEDTGEVTGFEHSFDAAIIVSEDETARLYVEYPHKRVVAGTSATYTIWAEAYNDFTADITLDATGLPTNATDAYSTNPIAYNGSTTATITTTDVAAGTYSIFFTGTAVGGDVGSVRVILEVVASDDCAPKVPIRKIRVKQGDNAVFTVMADPTANYTGNMDLSSSGVPAGASGEFADETIAYNEYTTFTVDSGTATIGEHEITITGEGPA